MKTIKMLLLAFLLAVVATPSFGQSTTTLTSLSVALGGGSNNNLVTVASATGITASTGSTQTFIAICDASGSCEQMQVRSISGTILTVIRAIRGTASPHPLNSPVWFGSPGTFIPNTGNTSGVFVGATPFGLCTRTNNQFLPVINTGTGEVSDCILSPAQGTPTAAASTTSTWVSTSAYPRSTSRQYKKLAVTATTYTLLPTDSILGYNTLVTGTVTIPALTGWVGKEYIVQLELTGTASITIAASGGQTINGGASITLPGTGGTTQFGRAVIYSDGVNWFAARQ